MSTAPIDTTAPGRMLRALLGQVEPCSPGCDPDAGRHDTYCLKERVEQDLERLESTACGFAWDMGQREAELLRVLQRRAA